MDFRIEARTGKSAIRFESRDGVNLLIASAVILREMVFRPHRPGNKSILVTGDVIRGSMADWNGVPVLLGHHDDPRGKAANVVGFTESPRLTSDGKGLAVDVVVNADRFPDIADAIANGADVSIGASARIDAVKGEFDGKPFDAKIASIVPDHLAVLMDQRGACSREDGCGIPLAACGDGACACTSEVMAVLQKARKPKFSGTSTEPWTRPGLSDFLAAYRKQTGKGVEGADVASLPAGVRRWIAEHTLLGDANADNFRDLSMFPVVEPDTGKLNRNALVAVISGRGAQARLDNSVRESAQSMARRLLRENFDMSKEKTAAESINEDKLAARIVDAIKVLFKGVDDNADGSVAAADANGEPEKAKPKADAEPELEAEGDNSSDNGESGNDVMAALAAAVKSLSEKIENNEKAIKAALDTIKRQEQERRRDLEAKVQAVLGLDDETVKGIDDDALAKIAARIDEDDLGVLGALRAKDAKSEKDPYIEAMERIEAAFLDEAADDSGADDGKTAAKH